MIACDSLGSGYKLVGFIPIRQQVGGFFVVHADVVILEHAGEEVVDLPRYVQDELNPEWRRESADALTTEVVLLAFVQSGLALFPYPLFCSSSKLDAFHSDPCWKHKQTSDQRRAWG